MPALWLRDVFSATGLLSSAQEESVVGPCAQTPPLLCGIETEQAVGMAAKDSGPNLADPVCPQAGP